MKDSVTDLIKEFDRMAISHALATENSNSRVANNALKKSWKLKDEIEKSGKISHIVSYLSSEDQYLKFSSAACLFQDNRYRNAAIKAFRELDESLPHGSLKSVSNNYVSMEMWNTR